MKLPSTIVRTGILLRGLNSLCCLLQELTDIVLNRDMISISKIHKEHAKPQHEGREDDVILQTQHKNPLEASLMSSRLECEQMQGSLIITRCSKPDG